jgi:hypothetical protein
MFVFITNIVKLIAICLMLIGKMMKVDTKLLKIVLYCNKFELNEAIGNIKAKVDIKLMESVLKCTVKLNLAIGNAKAK